MATKEAVFSLRVDTGNSVQDIQNADQAVKNFNKDLKETQVTAASGTGVNKMQTDLQALNAKVEAGGLTMRQMTQAMKEYQSIAAQAGVESPVGQEAIRSAAELKDRIGDLKGATTALSSDFVKLDTTIAAIGVGASVFQGLSSAISLSGIENEQLTKTMVKLQAVQGVSNAISQIANALNKDAILGIQLRIAIEKIRNLVLGGTIVATKEAIVSEATLGVTTVATTTATTAASVAMKVLRMALISTGIGALVIGVGLLIANFETLMKPLQFVIQGLKDFGDFLGVTDNKGAANAEKAKKRSEATINQVKKEAEARNKSFENKNRIFTNEDNALGRQIALMKAQGKDTTDLERKRIKASISYQRGIVNETYGIDQQLKAKNLLIVAELRSAAERTGDFAAWNKFEKEMAAARSANAKINQDANKAMLDSENELRIFEQELINDKRQASIDAQKDAKNNSENRQKEVKEVIDISTQIQDAKIKALADGEQKELEVIRVSYERKKLDLEKQVKEGTLKKKQAADLIKADVILQGQEEQKIRDKYSLERIKKEDEAWLKQQEIDLSKQDYEKLLLMQKFDAESLLTEDIVKLTRDTEEALKAIDDKYEAEAEAKRQNRLKVLNSNLLTESEQSIQNEINSFNNQKKELDKFLLSKDENEKITQEQHDLALIELEKKKTKSIADIKKKAAEDAKIAAQKVREEELKGISNAIETADKALEDIKIVNDLLNEIGTARINKINEERDEDLLNLDAKQQAELNAEGLTAKQKTDIEQKFAKQKYDVQLEAFNKEDKINRAKFNRDKAIKLAEVGINTASAIVKGIAEFGPPPSAAGIASILTAGVIGTTQALAITNQKYQGGTMPTMPSISSSGGGGLAGTSASSFTSQPTTQTSTSGLNANGQLITAPVQVFVLENDISSTQNKVALQESKSSF